jgi:hypothetical protein
VVHHPHGGGTTGVASSINCLISANLACSADNNPGAVALLYVPVFQVLLIYGHVTVKVVSQLTHC